MPLQLKVPSTSETLAAYLRPRHLGGFWESFKPKVEEDGREGDISKGWAATPQQCEQTGTQCAPSAKEIPLPDKQAFTGPGC